MTPSPRRAVLVVDDDPGLRRLIAEVLRDEGYAVVAVGTIAAAIAALAQGRFALVLADTFRFTATGDFAGQWVALDRLRTAAGVVPAILCTAHSPHAFADYAAHGFRALLHLDPFDPGALLETVRRHLDAEGG